ncbi:MAG: hypothetical protein GY803_12370 [Chloroflexi bacterium]|nr:hypothetical protein [Chloroflexota bacterium]
MTIPINHRHTAAVPLYHWRGARPQLFDLDSDQTGWLICLSLGREGDCSLLPIAWQQGISDLNAGLSAEMDNPVNDSAPYPALPIPTIGTEALDSEAVSLTLADLRQDGWRVNGRITLHFTGYDADPDFQQTIEAYLWRKPGA